ncbi:hypothetical protein WJX72_008684 [[Myrmecia] bisecta]|uniref:Uncharacterized protein n=1 Tax=[Myrmecia] bisecta TaxID=41462 RepID=A0AAW1PF79_9CHLO
MPNFSAFVTHLRRAPVTSAKPQGRQLSEVEATALYCTSLSKAVARESSCWVPSTNLARFRGGNELEEYLLTLPSSWGRSLRTATPEDIVSFCESTWLPKHVGSVLPDGSAVAAPSGLKVMLSHLSTLMTDLGRAGPWDDASQTGNPLESDSIARLRKGYTRHMRNLGYEEGSAVPISLETHQLLLSKLDQQSTTRLLDSTALPSDYSLVVQPNGTKTRQLSRLGGHPIVGYLLRPVKRDRSGFDEKPLTAGAIYQRLTGHLKAFGLYHGESVHSYRRGNMQHRHHRLGETEEAVGERALINTPSVRKKYLDQSRHHRKMKRVERKSKTVLPAQILA